jgi:hypothetical protein
MIGSFFRVLASGCLALGVGCSADTRSPDFASGDGTDAGGSASATMPGTALTDASTSGAVNTDAASGSGDTAATGAGIKLDVAPADAESGAPSMGCTAVDVLFVIDNSGSMCGYQSNLAQTLPDFADAIFTALPPDTSIHVGITTTSFSSGGSHQEQNCTSVQGPAEIDDAFTPPTEGQVPGNGYQGRLLQYEGLTYFDADTGDPSTRLPLMNWFANAAFSVDCNGGAFEFPSAAAAYAVDPVNDVHNEGFLRDEGAVLAIFVLSDEVDQSPEGLDTYRNMILDAKAGCGGETCISTAGLLDAGCVPSDPMVWQFLDAFGKDPVWGDIGDGAAYEMVVETSLSQVIEQTCSMVPAG